MIGKLGAGVAAVFFLVTTTAPPGMASVPAGVDAALAWLTCLDDAADALYEQPDPAMVLGGVLERVLVNRAAKAKVAPAGRQDRVPRYRPL